MYKVKHLGETLWFKSFEEAAKYYKHEEITDLKELNEKLKEEAPEGMVPPIVEEI